MNQINPKTLDQKTKTIYNALNKQHRWYTGLPIKKYINEHIFQIKPGFGNKSINSGRWSAYCHYTPQKSLENLLEKNNIDANSNLLVHPLLPNNLLSIIKKTNCKITTIDINKNSLNFETNNLKSFIEKTQKVDLVINYPIVGIYEDAVEHLRLLNIYSINSITIINNSTITTSLLDLFENLKFGGVIINGGNSFVDNHLNEVIEKKVENREWFYSLQIEHRTQSILEYHLRDSHKGYSNIVEAYYYLLLSKKPNILHRILPTLAKNTILKSNFTSTSDAENEIHSKIQSIYDSAVPDIFFELEYIDPKHHKHISYQKLTELDSFLHHKNNELHKFMVEQISRQPSGTLEVPKLFTNKTYLEFPFYTSNHEYWNEYFSSLGLDYTRPEQHSPSLQLDQYPNSNFASTYLARLNLLQILYKSLNF